MHHHHTRSALFLAVVLLILTALACTGTVQNLRIEGLPQYVCPSSTPYAFRG